MEPYCCICQDIFEACDYGHTKCLKYYLSNFDVNRNIYIDYECFDGSFGKHQETLLHILCKKNYGDCVRILLKNKNLDPNIVDDNGNTALRNLCNNPKSREKIIKLLLEDPRNDVNSFITPPSSSFFFLMYQVNVLYPRSPNERKEFLGIVKLFIQLKASTKGNWTPDIIDVHDVSQQAGKFEGRFLTEILLDEIINRILEKNKHAELIAVIN